MNKVSKRDALVHGICTWLIKTFATKEYAAFLNVTSALGTYTLEKDILKVEPLSDIAEAGKRIYEREITKNG